MLLNLLFVIFQSVYFVLIFLLLCLKLKHSICCLTQQFSLCGKPSLRVRRGDVSYQYGYCSFEGHWATWVSFSPRRRVASSETQFFFSSRSSFSLFCNSAFQSTYLFFADEASRLCSCNSFSRLMTCARYFRSLLYCEI